MQPLFPPSLTPAEDRLFYRTFLPTITIQLILMGVFGAVSTLTLMALNAGMRSSMLEELTRPVAATLLALAAACWIGMVVWRNAGRRFAAVCIGYLLFFSSFDIWMVAGRMERVLWIMPLFLLWQLAIAPFALRPSTFLAALVITTATPLLMLATARADAVTWWIVVLNLLTVGTVAFIAFRASNRTRREMFLASLKMRRLAWYDALTALLTRRRFFELAEPSHQQCMANGTPVSACFFDLDDFKRINDVHGHREGDRALERTAAVLARLMPHEDDARKLRGRPLAARMGGEEFALHLPGYTLEQAETLAESLLDSVRQASFDGIPLRASIGVAQAQPGESLSSLLHAADMAMLQAKREGKNRVVAIDGPARLLDDPD